MASRTGRGARHEAASSLGLSLSSSWGNGHATTYRALLRALAARGHDVLFLERDVPWYARQPRPRRPGLLPTRTLRLARRARDAGATRSRDADAVIVGSYVPEGVEVGALRAAARARRHRILRHRHAGHAGQARARRLRVSLAGADPRLRPLSVVHRRPDARGGSSAQYGAPTARALYCSVDPDALSAARRAEALGSRLSRHLQRRPPADARAAADRAGARAAAAALLRRRAAISRRHRLAGERRADRASAAGRASATSTPHRASR